MVDGTTERDIERLRAAYLLTDQHAKKLARENIELKLQIARLEGRVLTQDELELPLPETTNVTIGDTETDSSSTDADIGKDSDTRTTPPKDEKPGHGPHAQPKLPIEIVDHTLANDQCECDICGGRLEEIEEQTEDSEEITVIERTYKIVVNQRLKYHCCDCHSNVITAPMPPRLVPGGRYSNEFAISIAIDKYADNIPLERQVERMARSGLVVTSSTLVDQLHALTDLFEPVKRELFIWAFDNEPVINVDETGWPFADRKVGKRRRTAWCVSSPRAVIHHLLASKSTKTAQTLIGGYEGVVVADGYQVYVSLARAEGKEGFTLANCWAHVLRKFRDCLDSEPQKADEILNRIGKLYDVEHQVDGPFPGNEEAQAKRLRLRQIHSLPITNEIRQWAFSQGGLRRSDFGKTIAYMLKRWERLTVFLSNPRVPLDNNHAERSLRKLVIGRKVHYGSRSEAGLRFAEVHYSLIDSCLLNDVDPLAYYRFLLNARLNDPQAIILPHEYASSIQPEN